MTSARSNTKILTPRWNAVGELKPAVASGVAVKWVGRRVRWWETVLGGGLERPPPARAKRAAPKMRSRDEDEMHRQEVVVAGWAYAEGVAMRAFRRSRRPHS
jgi:hypothetical protein